MRKAKKSPNKSRGFRAIYGKTVLKVDTKAINVAKITFTDGTQFEITGEDWFKGIPAIECVKHQP